jgi:tRNA A37 threonylcarbamoyladenosine dehydratase
MEILARAKVAVYGLGGVGAACAMDLVRVGIGNLLVVDFDTVDESNLNRLYFGFRTGIGKPKTEVFLDFAHQVNPDAHISIVQKFFSGEEADSIIDRESHAHADCVDSLNSKTNLIAALLSSKAIFISSMGTAGRMRPEMLKLGGIRETSGCPLAKSVRVRLRHMGIEDDFPVVWSDEPPRKPVPSAPREIVHGRIRMTQGSSPFVPQAAGHIMASWIVRTLLATMTQDSPS